MGMSKSEKTLETMKNAFFLNMQMLADLQQFELLEKLIIEVIGSVLASYPPEKRVALKNFVDDLVNMLGEEVFEDTNDLESFLDEE